MTAAAMPLSPLLAARLAPSAPLAGTASASTAVARVSYTHDAMIDLIIAKPDISVGELAKAFGYTVPWISRVKNSDAFLARLAERKAKLVDPMLVETLDEKIRAIADASAEIVHEKLVTTRSVDLAMKALDLSTRAMGYGARQQNVAVQASFVVALPPKAASAEAWAAAHSPSPPAPPADIVDVPAA